MRTVDGAVGIATRPSEKLAADEKVAAKRSIENPSISTCSNYLRILMLVGGFIQDNSAR